MTKHFTLTLEKARPLKVSYEETMRLMRHSQMHRSRVVESITGPYRETWDLWAHDNREGIQWLTRRLGWRWQHIGPAILGWSPGVEAVVLRSPESLPGKADAWEAGLVYVGHECGLRARCPLLGIDVACGPESGEARLLMDDTRLWLQARGEEVTATFELGTLRV